MCIVFSFLHHVLCNNLRSNGPWTRKCISLTNKLYSCRVVSGAGHSAGDTKSSDVTRFSNVNVTRPESYDSTVSIQLSLIAINKARANYIDDFHIYKYFSWICPLKYFYPGLHFDTPCYRSNKRCYSF